MTSRATRISPRNWGTAVAKLSVPRRPFEVQPEVGMLQDRNVFDLRLNNIRPLNNQYGGAKDAIRATELLARDTRSGFALLNKAAGFAIADIDSQSYRLPLLGAEGVDLGLNAGRTIMIHDVDPELIAIVGPERTARRDEANRIFIDNRGWKP